MADYQLREARPADAEDYVRCHVDCLAETYAAIMPPAFVEDQRRRIPERIVATRAAWSSGHQPDQRPTRSWLALDENGAAVGVASSGEGQQPWEAELGAPEPPTACQLDHIYTLSRTHGTGLGQALLDLAIGDHEACLWILHGNRRAQRFYLRNGFCPDGVELSCGPTWFDRRMFRMVRFSEPRS
jgi:GNAT superfamily N-acetyltransferase